MTWYPLLNLVLTWPAAATWSCYTLARFASLGSRSPLPPSCQWVVDASVPTCRLLKFERSPCGKKYELVSAPPLLSNVPESGSKHLTNCWWALRASTARSCRPKKPTTARRRDFCFTNNELAFWLWHPPAVYPAIVELRRYFFSQQSPGFSHS